MHRWLLLALCGLSAVAMWQKQPLSIHRTEDGKHITIEAAVDMETSENSTLGPPPAMATHPIRIDANLESEFIRLVSKLKQTTVDLDMNDFERECRGIFDKSVCVVMIRSALPSYMGPSSDNSGKNMFFALMKAAACVISALVVVICIYGHVESRRRQQEDAVDCKYSDPHMSKKFDFDGSEIFGAEQIRPSVKSLLRPPVPGSAAGFTTASNSLVK
uniref:Uncharacterized protein n=2 Tax=Lotharella globosa TaxID=91324 RepID=A0A7S3YTA9_9EUKA|mmetsp:Transcript_5768/g.11431  ORF Transcript_5768/g.11431 Transcript_5768/m.11431 type:complete len:217 (+) Transcript_5768:104-754(+)